MAAVTRSPAQLVEPDLYAEGDPHALWRWMRTHAPVYRHPPADLPAFWSLTRYDDIRAVYRDPAGFSSAYGVLLRPTALGSDPGGGMTLALSDPPRHKQLRATVADWFSTRAVRDLEESIHRTVRAVLTLAAEWGECDFVHDIAGRLSMYVIGDLLGVPGSYQEQLFHWTNEAFEAGVSLAAHQDLMRFFIELMQRRLTEPADDLVSVLVGSPVDGELLTEEEILLNCENLVGATENGRLAIAGGMLALLQHPQQWQRLADNRGLIPSAIEEILRWTSSATHSMRTATAPRVIRGQRIEAGDRVVLWVPSANHDEGVFPEPYRFDIGRNPNRHLALGSGEHFCLGANLARVQLRVLLLALLDAGFQLELNGPVKRVRSLAVGGPAVLPVRLVARSCGSAR